MSKLVAYIFKGDFFMKGKIKKYFYYIAVAFVAIFMQVTFVRANATQEIIFDAFGETKASFECVKIDVKGVYKGDFVYEDNKEDMIKYICGSTKVSKEDINLGRYDDVFYMNVSTTIDKDAFYGGTDGAKAVLKKKNSILDAMEKMNMDARAYITVQGSYKGRLTRESIESINSIIYECLFTKAGELKSISDNGTDCVSYGYSEALPDKVSTGGTDINVGVTFSYDEIMDVTNIYIATPMFCEDI